MSFSLNALLILSIAVSTAIAWIQRKKIDPSFIPFTRLLATSLLSTIISASELNEGFSDANNYNLFVPLQFLLITWQFQKWGLFRNKQWLYFALQGLCIVGYSLEQALTSPDRYYSYFILGHAIVIVLMSISQANLLLASLSKNLARDPIFLICTGLVIYFTFMILVESFWIYGISKTQPFRNSIQEILTCIHILTNILFVFATIWIPLKPRYIMRS